MAQQDKPPLTSTVLKYLRELERDMTAMDKATVDLGTIPYDSAEYKSAFKKLREDQKEMAKKLKALERFDKQAKDEISEMMVNAIRVLGRLNLNSDDEEQDRSASIANQLPPTMTFFRRWTMERLGLGIANPEEAVAPEDLQIGHADADDLQRDEDTTGGGKTEITESSVPERKEVVVVNPEADPPSK